MGKPSLVVVLAEDERHVRFVRRYLYRLGYGVRDVRVEDLPSGRGFGEQWVRERYARAVKAYRGRSVRAKTALVVAIDADTGEVERRVGQFQKALEEIGMAPRDEKEAIAHLIPRRNIETWILCLNGRTVDDLTDYRHENDLDAMTAAAAVTSLIGAVSEPRRQLTACRHCCWRSRR